jgi:hypothetical protein
MHNAAGYWIIDNITYHIIIAAGIGSVLLFLLVKAVRYWKLSKDDKEKKKFQTDMAQVIRSALPALTIGAGLNVVAVFLLTEPPAFARLEKDDLIIIGLTTILSIFFLGITELITVLGSETAPVDRPAEANQPAAAPAATAPAATAPAATAKPGEGSGSVKQS